MKIVEIFQRVKQALYSAGASAVQYWGPVLESFPGAWQRNIVCESKENLLAFAAVYACVRLISDDVAKLRIKLMEQVQDVWQEVAVPAFSPVLRKPNRYQTRIQFLSQWIVCKLMYGNVYVYKIRDDRKVVVELYILDPRKVVPMITSEGDVYYQINQDELNQVNLEQFVPAKEIIHDRMLCLFHPLVGISPIYACGTSGTQGIKIQNNGAKFFDNMSRPSGHLTAPGKIDDETAGRLKANFEQNFTSGNIGRLLVTGSDMKYEPMTIPPIEAQMIEQLNWTARDVCRAFGIPPHKLGIEAPINTSVVSLNQDYYSQTLQIYIESIELLLDEGLGLDKVSDHEYGTELDLDGLLRMDQTSQMDYLVKAVGGAILSPDEARARINQKKVSGGDQVYLQQQNFSLAALAKRDAKEDPFGTAAKTEPTALPALPAPADETLPAEEPKAAENRIAKELADAFIAELSGAAHV